MRQMLLNVVAAAALAACGAMPAAAQSPIAVVELYTSQGCSSCPPADAYLGTLAGRADVLALTLPVDYWDYLGWKDTFAKHAFSERQRDYARVRGDGQVYTPQIVINGIAHAVGSHSSAVESQIEATNAALSASRLVIATRYDGDELVVEVGTAAPGAPIGAATLWLAYVTRSADVAIKRGENGGQKVSYTNIVRKLVALGEWTGQPLTVRLAKAGMMAEEGDACAVLLQAGKAGPIIGASLVEDYMQPNG